MAEIGVVETHDIELTKGRLRLYSDQRGVAPAWHETPQGDFVAVLGTLIHDGIAAPACLPRLLQDFVLEDFDWHSMLGIHTLLVRKHGILYVLNDGLGASKVYRSESGDVFSSSFLAACEVGVARHLDPQACYEYVINGSVFGCRTLAEGISTLPANQALVVGEDFRTKQLEDPIASGLECQTQSFEQTVSAQIQQLDQVFEPLAAHYSDRLRVSFSGGFDSRLMLAMLLRHDIKPTLFVYGGTDDEDVRIARVISDAESLPLKWVDKGAAEIDLDSFAESTASSFLAFDGWKVEQPLFDYGVDRRDRLSRHDDEQVPLNGSLGEIYRNFFYMPDRPSSIGAVISTFHSQYDPQAFTDRFDERNYRRELGRAMREAIGADSDSLARHQVEALYPKFRGRFWTGRDAQINQRFGPMFFPFLEHAAINNTAGIPVAQKNLGYLQGQMIAAVNPRLAAYPSDYGFALSGSRPLSYRLKTFAGTQRPPLMRKLSFRLKHRKPRPRSDSLSEAMLSRVLDTGFPVMRGLFDIERIYSPKQFGLIATLEYLAERLGLDLPKG
jgi:asparagine synthase (glutamine-hydrolysing)